MSDPTAVVVLRAVHHGGLAIVRSLGRLGVPVYVVHEDRWTPASFSRYCRGVFPCGEAGDGRADRLLDHLGRVSARIGGRPLLIPTADTGAQFVADYRHSLREGFTFAENSAELVHALSSKRGLHALATRLGVPTPQAFFPQSRSDVVNYLAGAALPVMVKAVDDAALRLRAGRTKYVVRSASELLSLYDRVEDPEQPNLMLQEYIPGGEDTIWMFNGYFDAQSECLFGLTGQKLRQFPPYTGATSLGVCRPNPEVARTTIRFMKALGYRGILDIGYRWDARDGLYKVLDANPRIGSTFRLFVDSEGMDVARAWYLDLTGRSGEVSAGKVDSGRRWLVEDFDLVSSLRYFRDGKLAPGEWLRSFRGVRETCFLSLRDPAPILGALLSDARELLARRWPRRFRLRYPVAGETACATDRR